MNPGVANLTNATQVMEAVQQGHAIAGVVGVEHWTRSPCAPVILGLVAFTLVISLWIVLLCLLKKISLWSLK
jgi:hypothetical protein